MPVGAQKCLHVTAPLLKFVIAEEDGIRLGGRVEPLCHVLHLGDGIFQVAAFRVCNVKEGDRSGLSPAIQPCLHLFTCLVAIFHPALEAVQYLPAGQHRLFLNRPGAGGGIETLQEEVFHLAHFQAGSERRRPAVPFKYPG